MNYQLTAFINSLGGDQGYARNTLQAYTNDLQGFVHFLKSILGRDPRLDDLTPELVKQYFINEKKSGLKWSTLNRRRAAIKRFSQYLIEQGYIEEALVNNNQELFPKTSAQKKDIKVPFLDDQEIQAVLETVGRGESARDLRDLSMVRILIETGISIGVLVGLNLTDLNLRQKRFRVKDEKGNTYWYIVPQATESIQQYLQYGRPDLTQNAREIAVFVSQLGRRITRQGFWQILKNLGEGANLSQPLSPRIIRHTAAKMMVSTGKPIVEIQKLLGHRNPLSTRFLVRRIKAALK